MWPLLVERAGLRKTIFYKEIAVKIGTHHRHVRHALGPIQAYCLDAKLPPLTAIVISKSKGRPGLGFIAWDMADLEHGNAEIFSFNWDNQPNPFGGFASGDTITSLGQQLAEHPDKAATVYARIKVREIAQRIFRSALITAYSGRCAMCRLGFEEALEGAHIIPLSGLTAALKIDPRNGLLLCSSHHRLFDYNYLTINSKYRIVCSDPTMALGGYEDSDKAMTSSLSGRKITLPADRRLWPSIELLSKRNEDNEWDLELLNVEANVPKPSFARRSVIFDSTNWSESNYFNEAAIAC